MGEYRIEENGNLPTPDLPFVDRASGSPYISLRSNHDQISITIRPQQMQPFSSNNNMVAPRAEDDNIISLHPTQMQFPQGATGINHLLMHEIHDTFQDTMQQYHRRETTNEAYERRLRTFRTWCVPFLDREVLAEANFCYTGTGDTVRCTVCGGELSKWQPGNDPRQEHINAFGYSCR